MLTGLISWLILIIIVALLYWILTQIPGLTPQILKIVQVVCIVVIVIALIYLVLLPLMHISISLH